MVPQAGPGAVGKDLFPLWAIKFRILDPPACSFVTMLTELSWLTSECKFEGKTGEEKSENRVWQEGLPGFKKETRTNRNKLGNALVTHSFIT